MDPFEYHELCVCPIEDSQKQARDYECHFCCKKLRYKGDVWLVKTSYRGLQPSHMSCYRCAQNRKNKIKHFQKHEGPCLQPDSGVSLSKATVQKLMGTMDGMNQTVQNFTGRFTLRMQTLERRVDELERRAKELESQGVSSSELEARQTLAVLKDEDFFFP